MKLRIGIEQASNHTLVLGVVLCSFCLEKLDALLA
jgi:hypothetical protein